MISMWQGFQSLSAYAMNYTHEFVLRRAQTIPPSMAALLFGVAGNAVGNGNEWVGIRTLFVPKRHFQDGDWTTLIGSPL
jgi:hypothetical protein